MPVMSAVESVFCRSVPWRWFARRIVLPWALDEHRLQGDVLEIGGGSGAMAEGVLAAFPFASLTITDIDDAMVSSARSRLAGREHVVVERADVTALPFGDSSFDSVTSYLMLHHVITWREAIAEATRVLRPGGTFVGYDLADTRLARAIHRIDRSPHRILSAVEMRGGLAAAGLVDISVETSAVSHVFRFRAVKPVD